MEQPLLYDDYAQTNDDGLVDCVKVTVFDSVEQMCGDMKWGRDPEEDDREWALCCSRTAKAKLGITPRTGRKR